MLIQFKVTNFRSITDEQILSLMPTNNQEEFPENILRKESTKFNALNLIALYGANGSGKSNILNAYGAFLNIIKTSAKSSSTAALHYDPFL